MAIDANQAITKFNAYQDTFGRTGVKVEGRFVNGLGAVSKVEYRYDNVELAALRAYVTLVCGQLPAGGGREVFLSSVRRSAAYSECLKWTMAPNGANDPTPTAEATRKEAALFLDQMSKFATMPVDSSDERSKALQEIADATCAPRAPLTAPSPPPPKSPQKGAKAPRRSNSPLELIEE